MTLTDVQPDGPAERAGLHDGDRLVSIAGKPVQWEFDYNKALLAKNPGDSIGRRGRARGRGHASALELGATTPVLVIWRRMGLASWTTPLQGRARRARGPGRPGRRAAPADGRPRSTASASARSTRPRPRPALIRSGRGAKGVRSRLRPCGSGNLHAADERA